MRNSTDKDCIINTFQSIFNYSPNIINHPEFIYTDSYFQIGSELYLLGDSLLSSYADITYFPTLSRILMHLLTCINNKQTPLLIGSTSSGKSTSVRLLSKLCKRNILEFSLNSQTDTTDLIGCYEQQQFSNENENKSKKRKISNSESFSPNIRNDNKFIWKDGILIDALINGNWLVLDNVNYCNNAVLDRFSSLFEKDPLLLINECGLINGQPRIIRPHPNFRLFMLMDQKNGELSRAMRNRCIELYLENIKSPELIDVYSYISRYSQKLQSIILDSYYFIEENKPELSTFRNFSIFSELLFYYLQDGFSLFDSLNLSYKQVYQTEWNIPLNNIVEIYSDKTLFSNNTKCLSASLYKQSMLSLYFVKNGMSPQSIEFIQNIFSNNISPSSSIYFFIHFIKYCTFSNIEQIFNIFSEFKGNEEYIELTWVYEQYVNNCQYKNIKQISHELFTKAGGLEYKSTALNKISGDLPILFSSFSFISQELNRIFIQSNSQYIKNNL